MQDNVKRQLVFRGKEEQLEEEKQEEEQLEEVTRSAGGHLETGPLGSLCRPF